MATSIKLGSRRAPGLPCRPYPAPFVGGKQPERMPRDPSYERNHLFELKYGGQDEPSPSERFDGLTSHVMTRR